MSSPKAPQGNFTLLYFAAATSYTRKEHDFFPAPMLVSQLYAAVEAMYPGIRQKVLESSALTVNLEYVDVQEETAKSDAGMRIQAGDEVAIIPPVSSG
ncbi:probable Molybdopterin synthase sulfur carrier subunit [Ramularia collo-cygni]|uniref:Molybdopterin synthase sulfur carrier subunit n=1 Tax=Ramularia collo-cygni TaxID=112498 RepID=A0A2D3VDZ1_9PEZI|nr:probable Molybdopterin synthase sulfur carrier subunit [Ramularia collo-cygni]CZT25330.1 probable Molybdopterin synthase sulfur carrier subunit [Ramularia collo-cygni]